MWQFKDKHLSHFINHRKRLAKVKIERSLWIIHIVCAGPKSHNRVVYLKTTSFPAADFSFCLDITAFSYTITLDHCSFLSAIVIAKLERESLFNTMCDIYFVSAALPAAERCTYFYKPSDTFLIYLRIRIVIATR